MKKISQTLAGILIGIVLAIGLAICIQHADATAWAGTKNNTTRFGFLESLNDFRVDGNTYISQEYNQAASAVSLTSPTTTFSVAGKGVITLSSDANQTGLVPTGGTAGQEITIISGTGSNTMRFDDGASMNLGGNITLTEGQFDVLKLRSIDGTNWVRLSSADN